MLLRVLLLCFFGVIILGSLDEAHAQPKGKKPNVIVVITDDQGYGDVGAHGNDIIQTPHLDSFYKHSTRLTNFHVSPTCSPTRGALITGRYSNRVGVWHTVGGQAILSKQEVTMSQIFAQNGYATGMFGKWHLGDNYPFRPEDRGFQEVVRHGGGGVGQGPDYWGNDYFDDTYWHNGELQQYKGYCTDIFFDEAIRFMDENKDRPFFAYISTNAPHSPYHVPKQYYNLYKEEENLLERQKRFYGMITNIDDNVGRLRDELEMFGVSKNTILIFMTDNGTAEGYESKNGKFYGFNGGLRGTKGSEYEGGHRVPFFISWPAGPIAKDKEVDQLTAHIDVLPTLIDMIGLQHQQRNPFDGKSFASLLDSSSEGWENRMLIVDSQRRQSLVKWRKSAVMDQQWRLVNGEELYNMSIDRTQQHNVAARYPEVVRRLRAGYKRWWTSLQEQKVNLQYDYIEAGTKYENPVRINAEYLFTGQVVTTGAWHQAGALNAKPAKGFHKVEITEEGRYRISLRRYPKESGFGFNQKIAGQEESIEISSPLPPSRNINLTSATLMMANISQTKQILPRTGEVRFENYIPAGKYTMETFLEDSRGRIYPAYYIYIEKI